MQPYGQPYPNDPNQQPYQDPYQQPYNAPVSQPPYAGYGPAPLTAVPQYVIPYGYDPVTGQALSDKSKLTAGLLQLLLGLFFGLGGVGRLYAGQVGFGITQIVASLVGWVCFWCGFVLIVPFLFYGAMVTWFVIDGIVMLAGRPVDGQGRLLRA
jgi:TM2 domain-containing membrane protein YozV